MSLRVRVALAGLATVAVVLLAAGSWLSVALERDGRRTVDRELAARTAELGSTGSLKPGSSPIDATKAKALSAMQETAPGVSGKPSLLQGTGVFTVLRLGADQKIAGDAPAGVQRLPMTPGFATRRLDGSTWRTLVTRQADGEQILLGQSLEPVLARVRTTRALLLRLGLVALAAAALIGFAIGTLALGPLQRLRRQAEAIGVSGAAAGGLTTAGPPEVAALGGALDRMLGRLRDAAGETERALESTRRFAGDAGHELRTPLAGMAADLAVLQDDRRLGSGNAGAAVRGLADQHARMSALLDALQTLALGDAGRALAFERIDLADVAEQAVVSARRRHPGRIIELVAGAETVPVTGWPDGLRAIADNLVENALRHGGCEARVRVEVRDRGNGAELRVDDTGPGVPEEDRARIFERFDRGSVPRTAGSGLGLSIVAQQAVVHAGRVTVGMSPPGGARFVVTLPRDDGASGAGR